MIYVYDWRKILTINSFDIPIIIISKNWYANFMIKLDIHQKSNNLDPSLLLPSDSDYLKRLKTTFIFMFNECAMAM